MPPRQLHGVRRTRRSRPRHCFGASSCLDGVSRASQACAACIAKHGTTASWPPSSSGQMRSCRPSAPPCCRSLRTTPTTRAPPRSRERGGARVVGVVRKLRQQGGAEGLQLRIWPEEEGGQLAVVPCFAMHAAQACEARETPSRQLEAPKQWRGLDRRVRLTPCNWRGGIARRRS